MNRLAALCLALVLITACKSKKKKNDIEVSAANFFVNDYIKGQVAKLDTALYSFQKVETADGRSDTVSIKNSDVRKYAKDFLELPDLSSEDMKDDYTVNHLYDDLQEAFIFTYTTSEDHPVREQHITIEPEMNRDGKNDIRSVYVDYAAKEGEAAVQKKMMWEHNSFYITTVTDMPSVPERIKTIKIIWNGFDSQNK